jgi:hypothetical protein
LDALKGASLCARHGGIQAAKSAPKTSFQIREEMKNKARAQVDAKKLEERMPLQKKMGEDAVKEREKKEKKDAKIIEIRMEWQTEINAIVEEVRGLRNKNPDAKNINAGTNGAIGTTFGGTGNPLTLTVPKNDYKISSAEIFGGMNGIDSSDSGLVKYRKIDDGGNILVHLSVK